MRILSIGNSFSDDAQEFVHDIAAADGVELEVCNLYIGGCSLERHWENAQSGEVCYEYRRNGETLGTSSLQTGLDDGPWDWITLQQASHDSGQYETYQPWLGLLADYVRERVPGARLVIHETWAYETDSTHGGFPRYGCDQGRMYACVHDAYARASADLGGVPVIPCGTAVQHARQAAVFDYAHGGKSLCRDGFHMHLTRGRYLLGACWYMFFTGRDILGNSFVPRLYRYDGCDRKGDELVARYVERPEFTPTEEEMVALRQAAHDVMAGFLG